MKKNQKIHAEKIEELEKSFVEGEETKRDLGIHCWDLETIISNLTKEMDSARESNEKLQKPLQESQVDTL